jgi:hypothetical protein
MKRILVALACILVGVTAPTILLANRWPDTLAPQARIQPSPLYWAVNDLAFVAGQCASYSFASSDVACGGVAPRHVVLQDGVISQVAAAVLASTWTTTEACDVELQIGGTVVPGDATKFEVGGVLAEGAPQDLRLAGEFQIISGLSIAVTAGQILTVVHNTPDDQTNCIAAGGCVCAGASANYTFHALIQ